jgi:hypothetical protein
VRWCTSRYIVAGQERGEPPADTCGWGRTAGRGHQAGTTKSWLGGLTLIMGKRRRTPAAALPEASRRPGGWPAKGRLDVWGKLRLLQLRHDDCLGWTVAGFHRGLSTEAEQFRPLLDDPQHRCDGGAVAPRAPCPIRRPAERRGGASSSRRRMSTPSATSPVRPCERPCRRSPGVSTPPRPRSPHRRSRRSRARSPGPCATGRGPCCGVVLARCPDYGLHTSYKDGNGQRAVLDFESICGIVLRTISA